jgi:hypothetical protein
LDWTWTMKGARYHEAAHAVAAYYHGWSVIRVIATQEEWRTDYQRPAFGGWSESWRSACVTLAGWFADQRASWGDIRPEPWAEFLCSAMEERQLRDEGEEWLYGDHGQLLDELEEMAAYPHAGTLEECYREVVEDTRELVSGHWRKIEAVADALERSGVLGGPEVVRVIEEEDA